MENYYILSDGSLTRHENTIYFENKNGKNYIPIEKVDNIYCYGQVSLTSQVLHLLAKKRILIHFFNYYGYYEGTFHPKTKLLAGNVIIKQAEHYIDTKKRLILAKKFVKGSADNMKKVLSYYKLKNKITQIEQEIENQKTIPDLLNTEARIRIEYYSYFDKITKQQSFHFEKRTKQPPKNMINALISFGNSLLYSTTLNELYNTQLNPTISYLHEPLQRRYSLTLDLTEIFKPIIVDRLIFKLINKEMITKKHFKKDVNYCILTKSGKNKFLQEYDKKLKTTLKHRQLNRNVSYKHLIRLEAYKLEKHILDIKEYTPYKIRW